MRLVKSNVISKLCFSEKNSSKNSLKCFLAFTLAEMMVVLLIISITLAVMAPVLTKKARQGAVASNGNSPWAWVNSATMDDAYLNSSNISRTRAGIGLSRTDFGSDNARLILNSTSAIKDHILFKAKVGDSVQTQGRMYLGNKSIALGLSAGLGSSDSEGAIALGAESGANSDYSIALGSRTSADGLYSVALGTDAKAVADNSIAIGYETVVNTQNTIKLGADSNYTVEIPGTLKVQGAEVPSDARLKYIGSENKSGLEKIKQLKVFNYTFKNDKEKTPRVGVIAQDLQKVFPDAVKKGVDGFFTVRMEDMFYAVVNAIKELDNKVSGLVKQAQSDREVISQLKKDNQKINDALKQVQDNNAKLMMENSELKARLDKIENKL